MAIKHRHILLFVMLHQIMCRSFLFLLLLRRSRLKLLAKRLGESRRTTASYNMKQRLNVQMSHLHRIIEIGREGAGESVYASITPSSRPTTSAKSKGKKRKQMNDDDDAVVEAINNFAMITKDAITDLIKQLASEKELDDEKMSNAQDKVLNVMETIPELTEDEKVIVTELLVDNYAKLSLFLRLGHAGRLSLAKRLLRGG